MQRRKFFGSLLGVGALLKAGIPADPGISGAIAADVSAISTKTNSLPISYGYDPGRIDGDSTAITRIWVDGKQIYNREETYYED